MKDKKSLALAYLTQSIKYLDLAEKIFEQMVNKGNPHVVTSIGGKHEPESIWKDYCEQTKWSDFNIIFPALFIFYHGIELMIKGLFPLMGSEIPFGHIDHKSDLLDKLKNEKGIKEFDGMWESSLTDSASKGKPDIELVDFTSRLQTIDQIFEVTTKPIIFDGDTAIKIIARDDSDDAREGTQRVQGIVREQCCPSG